MKYSVNTITFRSHLNSAMSDQIPWDMLLTIMESLSMTLDKSKEINYVLLDELKTYKQYYSLPPEEDLTLEINDVKEEQNVIKPEKSDSYEAAEDNQYENDFPENNDETEVPQGDDLFEEEIKVHCSDEEKDPIYESALKDELKPIVKKVNSPKKTIVNSVEDTSSEDFDKVQENDDLYEEEIKAFDTDEEKDPDYDPAIKDEPKPIIKKENSPKKLQKDSDEDTSNEESDGDNDEDIKILECDQCDKTYTNRSSLWQHKRHKHGMQLKGIDESIERVQCDQCDKKYTKGNLWKHKRKEHGLQLKKDLYNIDDLIERIQCDQCDKKFTKGNLWKHKRKEHGLKLARDQTLKCEHCQEEIPKLEMKTHLKTVHGIETPKKAKKERQNAQCSECGNFYVDAIAMRKHFKRVHGEYANIFRFKCEQCGKAFKAQGGLKSHIKIVHDGIRDDFTCDQCGKTFSSLSNVSTHIQLVHTEGSKKFPCEQCGLKCFTKAALKNHVRAVHEKIRDFICPECGKGSATASALKNHIACVHRGERNFECDVCHTKLVSEYSLKKHKIYVHEKIKVPCDQCGALVNENFLQKHIMISHEGLKPSPYDENTHEK